MHLTRGVLENMFQDVLACYRYGQEARGDGTTVNRGYEVFFGLPCRLSYSGSTLENRRQRQELRAGALVFAPLGADILPGDELVVTRLGREESFVAALPRRYVSHQEVPVTRREEA